MKQFIQEFLKNTRAWSVFGVSFLLLAWLLFYKLVSLTQGVSPAEVSLIAHGINLSAIYNDPLDLPIKLLQWLCFGLWKSNSILLVRLPNIILAGTGYSILVFLLNKWYGLRTTVLGAISLACSAWFLHISRIYSIDAEQFWAILVVILIFVQMGKDKVKPWLFYSSAVVLSLTLYVPSIIWFVTASIILNLSNFKRCWFSLKSLWQKVLYVLAWILPLSILIIDFVSKPSHFRLWLGLPAHFAPALTIVKRFGDSLLAFIFRAPANPAIWLGRLPILNGFLVAMLVIGTLFYVKHWHAPRTRMLLSFAIIGAILYALGGSATLSLMFPVVYLVVVAGIGYLLHEWLTVFPRNPLARIAGITMVIVVLGFSCFYGLRQYFVAWPNNPITRSTFHTLE